MMKKILICLLTFLSIGLNLQAQTVSVADIEALSAGETVQFKLHVSAVTAMTSMHFEVELPATFSVTGVSATSDWAAMFSREGGVVGAISSSDNALKGEGDAATVSVTVPPGTAVGEYPVTIDNIRRVNNGTRECNWCECNREAYHQCQRMEHHLSAFRHERGAGQGSLWR